ncbi:hypothetical protein TIMSHEL_58 [Mycobacterium phage Timshel]|uniref:Uncharacterized protein n=1 Tax=Mycobacterium phage Timshel TaxID=1032895 RepID=G1DB76_9CAUD|nr:hypothetical protein FDI10_gp36 [Mycobacterium phage Timshel]AEJ92400.1 hypothetical protein TIMSHEL_58 [Mycobacterium phage Timshel]
MVATCVALWGVCAYICLVLDL